MERIWKNLKSFSGALLGLAVLLIVLFWVLNFLATRAPAPLSTAASFVESHASGDAYN